MIGDLAVLTVGSRPVGGSGEWWERLTGRWQRWLSAKPGRIKAVLAVNVAAVIAVVVANATVDGFGRGFRVWLACTLMLVGWLAVTPTKTLRWVSVLRLFSASALWALLIALVCRHVSGDLGLPVRSPGPTVGIAAIMEETLKLAPLALLGFLAPGRLRRLSAVDWGLLGLAAGMGFQAAEDFVRRAASPRTLFSLFGDDDWRYGWTLFGGRFRAGHTAIYAGHHIETALVAIAIGLTVRLGRLGRWRVLWALPAVMWLVVVADHAGINAALADRASFVSGHSTVPKFLYLVWSVTGRGAERGWLLLALFLVAGVADARAQGGGGGGAGAWLAAIEHSAGIALTPFREPAGPLRAKLANAFAGLARERRRRELAGAPLPPAAGLLPTRVVAGAAGTLGAGASVLLARGVASRIGLTLRPPSRAWFAGLLDALGNWWDKMGPGGHAAVVAAGAGLVVLGGLLLLPELLGGGLIVTEGGVIAVGATWPVAAADGVTAVLAGSGILAMAEAGSKIPRRGFPDKDGRPYENDAARREALSRDPAQGWRVDEKSIREGDIGRALEDSGRLSKLWRDPTGDAEFIDEAHQAWDIKGFRSDVPGGFSLEDAMRQVARSLGKNENVILDRTGMSPTDFETLRSAVEQEAGWTSRVIWWP